MARGEVQWKHRIEADGLVRVRWSTDGGATWEHATVKTKIVDGHLKVTELRLPNPTTTSLRRLRFGALEHYLRQQLGPRNVVIQGATARARAAAGSGRVVLTRPDSARLGDAFYQQFAAAYTDASKRGLPPRPTLAADAGVSRNAIARWAKEARKRGFLRTEGAGKVSTSTGKVSS